MQGNDRSVVISEVGGPPHTHSDRYIDLRPFKCPCDGCSEDFISAASLAGHLRRNENMCIPTEQERLKVNQWLSDRALRRAQAGQAEDQANPSNADRNLHNA